MIKKCHNKLDQRQMAYFWVIQQMNHIAPDKMCYFPTNPKPMATPVITRSVGISGPQAAARCFTPRALHTVNYFIANAM